MDIPKDEDYWNNLPIRWICECGEENEEPWVKVPKRCKICGLPRGARTTY